MQTKNLSISFIQGQLLIDKCKISKIDAIKYLREICREPLTDVQIEVEATTGVKQMGYSIGLREAKDAVEHFMFTRNIKNQYTGKVDNHNPELAATLAIRPPIKALIIETQCGDVQLNFEDATFELLSQTHKCDMKTFAKVFDLFYLIEKWNADNA